MRNIIKSAAIASMLMLPGTARAAAVFYDFTAMPTNGPLSGDTLHGSFSIDSSLLGGPNLLNLDASGKLDSFNLVFNGTPFNTGNTDAFSFVFSSGALVQFIIGGTLGGSANTMATGDGETDFILTRDSFRYDVAQNLN